MARYLVILLMAGLSLLSDASFAEVKPAADGPFWRVKPKILKRIAEERAVVVVVDAKKKGEKNSELKMQGGGAIRRGAESTFLAVQNYHELKNISDNIHEAKFNSEKNELYLHTEAFHYHARMTLKMKSIALNKESGVRRLEFLVIDGNFKGMSGAFTFEDYKPANTLLGFEARYEYEKLPMPQFFVEFGLEFILQKMASRMRTFLEKPSSL